jgi:hypothetical protein
MKPARIIGIQFPGFNQDSQSPFPFPIQRQQPAQKADGAGALGLSAMAVLASNRNNSRSWRKEYTWAKAVRVIWLSGSMGNLVKLTIMWRKI